MKKNPLNQIKSWPINVKILLPLVVFLGVCTLSILFTSRAFFYKRLTDYALERSRQLAHSVGASSQVVHYPYELQRLIHALGCESNVHTLLVVSNNPLSIIASTKSTLIGKEWENLPYPRGIRLPNFPREQEAYEIIQKRHMFNYVWGFYLQRFKDDQVQYNIAYIVVQTNTYFWAKEILKQGLFTLLAALAVLIVLILICVTQINRWVTKPLLAIKRQMMKRSQGNIFALAPIFYRDEIGALANALNEMIHSQEKAENLFQNLVDIAPILLWTTNKDNTHFYFNNRWCTFVGQKELTYHDWSWLKHLKPELAQEYKAIFLNAQRLRQSVTFECQMSDYAGKIHWMLCQSTPQILKDGRFEGYISCLVDISERKENEKQLANYAEELAKARDAALASAQAKSTFLATMSHEIRTPINGILGFSYLLQDTPLSNEQRDYVKTIASSTQILLDLINQVLDLSKIEAKKLTLEPVNFHLDSFIKELCNIFQPTLTKKQIKLDLWIHPHIQHWLMGDEKRLRQIFLNLLSNAIKFTPSGTIFLRITGCKTEQGYLLFASVKDQGPGISNKDKKRIFEAFEQVAHQNKGGTGLGLPIALSLVQLMQGKLDVHSNLQTGSVFYFTVLLQEGFEEPEPSLTLPASFLPDRSPTQEKPAYPLLLLVEDNLENQLVAKKILEKNNFSVVVLTNGIQCLNWLQNNTPQLIVMDINMPGMDGFETTQRIRSGECGLDKTTIPIIGLTASALKETYDRAIDVGMNEVLTKPLHPTLLLNSVYKGLGQPST